MAQNHVISQSARCIKESEYSFFSMGFHVSLQCFHKLGNTKRVIDSNRSMILLFHTRARSRVFLHRLEDLMMQTSHYIIEIKGISVFCIFNCAQSCGHLILIGFWGYNSPSAHIIQALCLGGHAWAGYWIGPELRVLGPHGSVVNLLMYSRGQEGFTPNQWRDLHSFPLECAPSTLFFRENIHICFAKPFNFPQHLTTKQEE